MRIVLRREMYRYTTRLKKRLIMSKERRRFPTGITATKSAVKIMVRDVLKSADVIEYNLGTHFQGIVQLAFCRVNLE